MIDEEYEDMVRDALLGALFEEGGGGGNALFQESVAKEAERQGMTVPEYRAYMAKLADFDRMLTEVMRGHGIDAHGMYGFMLLADRGERIQSARGAGGKATAQIKKAVKAEAAQEAARIWDSLTTIPEHNRAAVIARRMGVSEQIVRRYLRETGRKTKRR